MTQTVTYVYVLFLQSVLQCGQQSEPHYTYFVKIIPSDKKGDAQTFEWHNVHDTFHSPLLLREKLRESFQDKLPASGSLQVGYIAKRGNGKRWIEQEADLASMYKHFEASQTVTLFCEGRPKSQTTATANTGAKSRKRKASSYSDHEEEIDRLSIELSEKHGSKYNEQQYRLWARMIVNNQHDNMDEPPNIPIITGGVKRPPRKEPLSDALTSVATALTKALAPNTHSQNSPPRSPKCNSAGISPFSKAKISTQYISKLKSLQDLRECGVLSEGEFEEQKRFALNNIRSINRSTDDDSI